MSVSTKIPAKSRSLPFLGVMVMVGLVGLGACKPKEVAQSQTPAEKASAPATAPVQEAQSQAPTPAPQAPASAPKKQEAQAKDQEPSIAGGWVNAGGACNSGAAVEFKPDGTYHSEGETGTWALDGDKLTVTSIEAYETASPLLQGPEQSQGEVGEKAVLTVLSVTEDAARVVLSNGSNASWTRCKG
jgi:hypothetical protein